MAWITIHSTLGTVLAALCKTSHADFAIKLPTGHRSNQALLSYQNLMGEEEKSSEATFFERWITSARRGSEKIVRAVLTEELKQMSWTSKTVVPTVRLSI